LVMVRFAASRSPFAANRETIRQKMERIFVIPDEN
jgi:hypothetical protein